MSAVDALITALADGRTMREAAIAARMPSAVAVREAKAFGWPDLDSIRAAAEDIRERRTPPPAALPGGDPVPPRTKTREPIPIEPDVEQAMTAGAAIITEARASVALDRDQTHDVGPVDVGELATSTSARDTAADRALDNWEAPEGQPQPAAEATGVDAALIEDTAATLQLLERITAPARPLGALTVEQRQRAVALREVADLVLGVDPGPTTGDLVALTDYIVTGRSPLNPSGAA